jgi:hypothetical protein
MTIVMLARIIHVGDWVRSLATTVTDLRGSVTTTAYYRGCAEH